MNFTRNARMSKFPSLRRPAAVGPAARPVGAPALSRPARLHLRRHV
ncbi:MAG: hypothetical protein WKG07_27765 [Hymenobacter sp.]